MSRISAAQVIDAVAFDTKLTPAMLISQARYRQIARPRQVAMLLMRRLCPHLSFPEIGRRLGGRDHTTILHGVRKIYALLPHDAELADQINRVEARLLAQAAATPPAPIGSPVAVPFDALCAGYAAVMRQAA